MALSLTGRTRTWTRWLGSLAEMSSRVTTDEGYALWAATYPPCAHNALMEAEQAIVGPMLTSIKPRRALDVGTGTGRNLGMFREARTPRRFGMDRSWPMLERARGEAPLVCGDALSLPFAAGSFDLVSSSLMAGDLADVRPWIREAARVLIAGGHLVYSDLHPTWSERRWRRTFRAADGRRFELPYFPHAINDHVKHLEEAALQVRVIREPPIAGRREPVVVVFHAVKRATPSHGRRS